MCTNLVVLLSGGGETSLGARSVESDKGGIGVR